MNTKVYITRTSAYLPLDPVGNEQMEAVLGMAGGRPSRARRMILRSNGIQTRHYAIDPVSGEQAMSHAQLTARAIAGLGDVGPVEVLASGTSMPDQLMPGHAVMVHGELGWPRLEAVSLAGICLAGTAALKHAWLSVLSAQAQRAVATGSELASACLRGRFFEAETQTQIERLEAEPGLAFEKDFLRWMLSDGAGALLLEATPSAPLSLRIDWIELSSAAHQLPACMYMGALQRADGSLRSWLNVPPSQWVQDAVFAVKQDVRLLNDNIVRASLAEPLLAIMAKRGLRADDITWFLPHMSSMYFAEPIAACLVDIGLPIPRERWFSNLTRCGNTGSASPFIMLDELFKSGRLKAGDKLLMFIPESGRFSSGFVMLEAVNGG